MSAKVNVDQFALDTTWRRWKWSWKRRSPWAYFLNRVQWYRYPKRHFVPTFPIHVDFEASSLCDLKCPMCYRPHRTDQNDGLMDFGLFKKGIDECASFGLYSIRLSWRGEPLLNPELPEMVEYAKRSGIKEVSFITNGVKMKADLAERLVEAGLDYLSVSIDGTFAKYESIRKPAKFEETLENLRTLRRIRDARGGGFPRIRVNSIWSAVEENQEEYFSIFSPIADFITVNPDYDHSKKKTGIDPFHVCQYIYQRLTVMWDGTVPLCVCDKSKEVVLGRLGDASLRDMWSGETIGGVRASQIDGGTRDIPPCVKCQRALTTQIGHQNPKRRRK